MADRTKIQIKTFTRWVNTHLADKDLKIDDLSKDFSNGVLLIELIQIISGKKIKKWKKKPKMMAQKLENLNKALTFVKKEGITLVNIGANDINSGNTKIILGLIWTLILRYQINKGEFEYDGRRASLEMIDKDGKKTKKQSTKKKKDGAKKELLKWVNDQIAPYGEKVSNFKNDWKDPTSLCTLCDSLQPGIIDVDLVKGDRKGSDAKRTAHIEDAMKKAQRNFKIPEVMDASDMATLPDELSVMTYVSYYRDAQREIAKKAAAAEKSFAEGPGLEEGPTGEKREFFIHCITNDNKPMVPEGDEPMVEVTISDPDGNDVKVEVVDPSGSRPGVYPIVYEASVPGSYMINCKVKGGPLKGFPRTVEMNSNAEKVETCNFSFTVQAADGSGKQVNDGGDTFEVQVNNCSSRQNFAADAKDNGNGSYTAAYTLVLGNLYKVYAKLNGAPIANTPFIHDLRTGIDKEKYVY